MARNRKWLSWNVRGLGSSEKTRSVRELIKRAKLELCLLQETKLDEKKLKIGEKLAKSLNMKCDIVPATGSAGGLISCWDPDTVLVEEVLKGQRYIVNVKLIPRKPVRRHDSWVPPLPGILKINVDGAAKGCPGPCGIGGILRNAKNEIKGFFSKNIGNGFSFEAEILAIFEALKLCHQYQISNIIIESDSKLAVTWVNQGGDRPWKLRCVLNQIDMLIPLVNCLEVRHIYREANSSADALAKRGSTKSNALYYFNSKVDL